MKKKKRLCTAFWNLAIVLCMICCWGQVAKAEVISGTGYTFDTATGEMFLSGSVEASTIKNFSSKGSVKYVEALPSTVLPASCDSMFSGYSACIVIDLSKADGSKVTSTKSMFNNCSSLKVLDLSGISGGPYIYHNVSNAPYVVHNSPAWIMWNTNPVKNDKDHMGSMFSGCSSLINLTLGSRLDNIPTVAALSIGSGWCKGSTSMRISGSDQNYAKITNIGINDYHKLGTCDPLLKIARKTLVLYNSITLEFAIDKASFDSRYPNMKPLLWVFQRGGVNTISSVSDNGQYYLFDVTVAPQMMGDYVTVVPMVKYSDGKVVYGAAMKYSAVDYCKNMLGKSEYQTDEYKKLRALLVDILIYGEKAQQYRNYRLNQLATAWLTSNQRDMGTEGKQMNYNSVKNKNYATVSSQDSSASIDVASLFLADVVDIRYRITVTASSISGLALLVADENGNKLDQIMLDSNYLEDGGYVVRTRTLNASQMRKTVDATIIDTKKGNKKVSNTFRFSIESYAAAKVVPENTDNALKDLLNAMMRYGDSAKTYVGK